MTGAELRRSLRSMPVPLGVGTAMFDDVSRRFDPANAVDVVDRAIASGIGYFDTAPLYGHGRAETLLGAALRNHPREAYVLSTKVGRVLDDSARGWTFDYSRDGLLRSLDASLARLGVDHVDLLLLHDPDTQEDRVHAQAWPVMRELRASGVARNIGVGITQWQMPARLVERLDLDAILLASRYTLLEPTEAEPLLSRCAELGVAVVLGGVYNSGILVDPDHDPMFDYRPAPADLVDKARRLRSLAVSHGLTLRDLALQFCLRHEAVAAALVGVSSWKELDEGLASARVQVPAAVWEDLAALHRSAEWNRLAGVGEERVTMP